MTYQGTLPHSTRPQHNQLVLTHSERGRRKGYCSANSNSANVITVIHWRLPFIATAKNVATTASPYYVLIWKYMYVNRTKY